MAAHLLHSHAVGKGVHPAEGDALPARQGLGHSVGAGGLHANDLQARAQDAPGSFDR